MSGDSTGADVEALALVLRRHGFFATHADRWNDSEWQDRFWAEAAQAVLASDWLAAREAAARAEVVAGVRAWCAINETAAPPLDWEGLGEFLARVAREARP